MRKIYYNENGIPDLQVYFWNGHYSIYNLQAKAWEWGDGDLNDFENDIVKNSGRPEDKDGLWQNRSWRAAANFIQEMNR